MSKLQRLRDNIAAIKNALSGDSIDIELLNKYSGFGGLGFILNPYMDKSKWSKSDLAYYDDTVQLHKMLIDASGSVDDMERWINSLKASTLTAFYTPQELVHEIMEGICSVYDGEYDQKKVCGYMLDPAAGMGVFGRTAELVARCNGVNIRPVMYENDILTATMLKARMNDGKSIVYCDGFEKFPEDELGLYDLVSTNVPFGNIAVYDKAYSNSDNEVRRDAAKMIHRYYVLKGLDCLRDGGLLAYIITSNYINNDSDQIREALKQSRLVGAYRLANNLFKENGTEVGTDLLVLQKDLAKKDLTDDECLLLTAMEESGCPTSVYFMCHPDHVIATDKAVGTDAYGKPGFVYTHKDGVKGIAEWLGKVLAQDMKRYFHVSLFEKGSHKAAAEPKQEKQRYTKKELALLEMQQCYKQLYDYEQTEQRENEELRQKLNAIYDEFVEQYGKLSHINNAGVVKRIAADLKGLEVRDEKGRFVRSDIMMRPIAFSDEPVTVTTPEEALSVVLNECGHADMDRMSELTGKDKGELYESLRGLVYFNPISGKYEIASTFLSGNVIEKLEIIHERCSEEEQQDPLVKEAIKALEDVVPTPIPFEELDFNLGERWVDAKVYGKFASEFFSMGYDPKNPHSSGATTVTVAYEPSIDQYATSCSNSNEKVWSQYAVWPEVGNRLDGMDLLLHALQNSCPKIYRYKRDSKGYRMRDDNYNYIKEEDPEKIQLANTKIEEIRQGYVDWLQRQPKEFCDMLADAYNRRFNCFVKPRYDGSHQTFPGIDMAGLEKQYGIKSIYQSQKDCVWMLTLNGGGICDHEVGSGKTLIMCIAAHEMKRLGMCHKPMIIGLKANVSAIAETYRTAYPQARVLFATEADYSSSNRQDFFNRMKNNDYDCIIMSHDQFGRIPQSDEIQQEILQDELRQVDAALDCLKDYGYNISSRMRRGLEMRKRNLKAKLEKLEDTIAERADDVVDFAMMGIDHIFVDESHQFKNLGFTTRHDRVAGLGNTEGSQRAFNLLMAIRTIQKRTGRDLGATFLSGTTVTNSLTELYSLFRYLRPKALAKQNITCFDAWAAIFTKKTQEFEFSITNTIQLKERFRYFIKVPELAMMYNEITDFRTAEDVGIDRPKKKPMLLNIKPTPDQEEYIGVLMEFAKTGDFKLIGMDHPTDKQQKAKMLYATDLARKMSLDMRMIDQKYGDHPNSKASRCAELIWKYYKAFDAQKGTQMVFSDLSTWQNNTDWSVYSEIKHKLVAEYGMKPGEIRFIQEAKNDKAKQQLIKDTNEGKIRVLFGSTSMLGTGVNAQKRVVAVHHLDTPWRPSDLEQRDGRAIRKGNEIAKMYADNKVDIIIYAVERSLDSYKFNLLHCKQVFINQLKRGQLSIRTLDEGAMDENTGMNFAEYMAVLSGNRDLLERAKLEKKIVALEGEKKNFLREQREYQETKDRLTACSEGDEKNIAAAKVDLAAYNKARRIDEAGNVINDLVIAGYDGDTDEASLGKEMLRIDRESVVSSSDYTEVGSIYGFPVVVRQKLVFHLSGEPVYENRFYVKGSHLIYQSNDGKLNHSAYRLAAEYPLQVLETISGLISQWEQRLETNRERVRQLETILTQTWGKEETLKSLRSELSALDKKIEKELKEKDGQQSGKKAA